MYNYLLTILVGVYRATLEFLCQIDDYYKISNVIRLAILGFFGQLNDYKYGF
jgi:hypothetical protein